MAGTHVLIIARDQRDFASLPPAGYKVVWGYDAADAIKKAVEDPPGLMVIDTDLFAPEGGWLAALTADGRTPPPILVVCPPDKIMEQLRTFKTHSLDYLLKGFSAQDLEARIQLSIMRSSRPAPEPPPPPPSPPPPPPAPEPAPEPVPETPKKKKKAAPEPEDEEEILPRPPARQRTPEETEKHDNVLDIMVYDLRAPLASIQVGLDFIRSQPEGLAPVHGRVVETLFFGCSDLRDVLENFLDLEQWEQKPPVVAADPLDSVKLLNDVAKSSSPFVEFRGVELAAEISSDLPKIKGDGKLLGRALQNLILSAVKLSNPKSTVSLRGKDDDGLVVEVENQNHTIPVDARSHIFDRYFHRGKGGWIFPRGFGTALAYCRTVVRAHGGKITVATVKPEGNLFRIHFPK